MEAALSMLLGNTAIAVAILHRRRQGLIASPFRLTPRRRLA
ncbi:MAG: hypothetical protein AW09_001937 [Candidatus Accumulibacter phosphatis]|uniref:Uncharacterized protein n=1 Tax=Candidatus Accumulibacter phosphatis TaxID=327160 RepID=A0A080M6V2_9PROT|nr:MAG: hypothetical protein AW09_001937 [Candidatus Accumulibacter phosphatis]